MSLTRNDFTLADRDAVVPAYVSIRMVAPNKDYCIFADRQYPWLVPVAENLERLLCYERDWDSHGALQLSGTAVQETFSMLCRVMTDDMPIPRLSATPSGGIQIEWRVPNVLMQVEVEYHGTVSAFFSDTRNGAGEEWEDENVNDISPIQVKLVRLKDAA